MKFKIASIFLAAVMIFTVFSTACIASLKYGTDIPFDNPQTVLQTYFETIAKKDFKTAYDMLSIETRKGFTESQYIELQQLYLESLYTFIKTDITIAQENMPAVDSIRYASVYEYACKLSYANGFNNTTAIEEMTYYVVAEDNKWKVHFPNNKIKYQDFLVYAYTRLGIMYSAGTKVAVDKAKALDYFIKILEFSKDNALINTYAALACLDLEKYDDALKYAAVAEKNADSDNLRINIMCIKAAVYAKTDKLDEANDLFGQAQALEDSLPDDPARTDFVKNFKAKYIN